MAVRQQIHDYSIDHHRQRHRLTRFQRDVVRLLFFRRDLLPFIKATRDHEATATFECPSEHRLCVDRFRFGVLRLSDSGKVHFVRPAADLLFVSVANYYRERTIGVVLTGCGVDGSQGVEAISSMGGYVIAQEPQTAEARWMPKSAIHTGCVDAILPLNQIAPALLASLTV